MRPAGSRDRWRSRAIRRPGNCLLAELAAILPRDANRMLAFLGKSRVVDDPRRDGAMLLNCRQRMCANAIHHRRVAPFALADEMQHRLVMGGRSAWRRQRCHRLNAFAIDRQQQSRAITRQRPHAAGIAEHAPQIADVGRKALAAAAAFVLIHASSWSRQESRP